MNCSIEEDGTVDIKNDDFDEEEESSNNYSDQLNPFSDSSHCGSSTDEEQLASDADGTGDIDDLVKGIDTSFDNTNLDEA